jgi:hypothetical protein
MQADIAQLVERNLAKVEVASSSLVVRSEGLPRSFRNLHGGLAERRGNGLQIRLHGFKSRTHLCQRSTPTQLKTWAIGAAVARFLDTEEVTGSNPVSPTREHAGQRPVSDREPASRATYVQQGNARRVAGTAHPGTGPRRRDAPCGDAKNRFVPGPRIGCWDEPIAAGSGRTPGGSRQGQSTITRYVESGTDLPRAVEWVHGTATPQPRKGPSR